MTRTDDKLQQFADDAVKEVQNCLDDPNVKARHKAKIVRDLIEAADLRSSFKITVESGDES